MTYLYSLLVVTLSILFTTACEASQASPTIAQPAPIPSTLTARASSTTPSTFTPVSRLKPERSSTPLVEPNQLAQPTLQATPGVSLKPTNLPPTRTSTLTSHLPNSAIAQTFFPVGPGFTDVIPHQIVRTNLDRVYIFAGYTYSTILNAYWTTTAGLPNQQSDFGGSAKPPLGANGEIVSVDAVYDGGNIIHVLVITRSVDQILDYPFDTSANTFKTPITLAVDSHTVVGDYIGTSGVSGSMDTNGTLHVAYWTSANHINYRSYTYTSASNTLTPTANFFQVDSNGNANHPSLAISPADNSLTIGWVYGSTKTDIGKIAVRSRDRNGVWGTEQQVSTARAWTSPDLGINVDQGPSLAIDSNGTKHLTYIENWDTTSYYGHIHYVSNSGTGWSDQTLAAYTHDPALALNSGGEMYIIGHGHPVDTGTACISMSDMCTIKKGIGSLWNAPQLFATPPTTQTFDSSPSVKWSVIGWNRPETIEFLFFATPYNTPTLYYGRLTSTIVPPVPSTVYLPLIKRSP